MSEPRPLHRLFELSWIDFDHHVLKLANDQTLPLLDRARFCAITAANLDEFFAVQIAELEKQTVTASAGGGMVTVEADGKGTITRVKIDPSVADPKDVEMLEDLVLVAVNEAQKKASDLAKTEMTRLTGGLNLPFKLPF